MITQDISEVRMMWHNKKIWTMDEREFVEAGKKMVTLGISEKCHSVSVAGTIQILLITLLGEDEC